MDAGPERGVGRVFADHGVVADELDGERVVVHQQFGRNGELGLGIAAVGAASWPGVGWMVANSVPFMMSLSGSAAAAGWEKRRSRRESWRCGRHGSAAA